MSMAIPTIEDVKDMQRELGLLDRHVVWMGTYGFRIAHTDEERASIDLESCGLHRYLCSFDDPPVQPGYYVAHPRSQDPESNEDPWEFKPL